MTADKNSPFTLTKKTEIKDLGLTFSLLTHEPTGAKFVHLFNPSDTENVFSICFQTLPTSSNGVAHILEHTVLCGSEKFPVKDPFFAMTRRSLNTYMNALTSGDFTCYPAASEIESDFYNLLAVYLDSVFHPTLSEMSFLQEGHRLEFKEIADKNSPLVYGGVVYNEMKGAMSKPDARLWELVMQHLMPDLTYAHNSGGDPKQIPTLTHAELKEFYKTFYHPSRAIFFLYGTLPLEKQLNFIEERCLKNVKKIEQLPPLPLQKRFTKPKEITGYFPAREEDKDAIFSFSFLTATIIDQEELLALSLLDSIFFENDASVLKHALMSSNLCKKASGYLAQELSEAPYTITCKGCKKEDGKALYAVIEKTLQQLATKGIDEEVIAAAMHQLAFSNLEIVRNGDPYGLDLFFRTVPLMQHGGDPIAALQIYQTLETLEKKLKDKNYLPNLIRRYFLDNPHQLHVTFLPDAKLTAKETQDEIARLEKIKANLSENEKEQIIKQSLKIEKHHEESENQDLSCLPKFGVNEISLEPKEFPLKKEQVGFVTCYHHATTTNQILYATLVVEMPELTEEELELFPLFLSIFTKVGVSNLSYLDNLKNQTAHLGSLSVGIDFYRQTENLSLYKPSFSIQGKALKKNSKQLLNSLVNQLQNVRFDETARIKELLLEIETSLEQGINSNAPRYASLMALSGFSTSDALKNSFSGLPCFKRIKAITAKIDEKLPKVMATLQQIKSKLLINNPQLIVTCDQTLYKELLQEKFYAVGQLQSVKGSSWQIGQSSFKVENQLIELSADVAFNCQAFTSIPYLHKDSALLLLATELMKMNTLHTEIREKGGAYGYGASYLASEAVFYFHTFRDPNIDSSFAAFLLATKEIAEGNFTEEELEQAKISIIQGFDTPCAPGSRGITSYNVLRVGKTAPMRKAYRKALLEASREDVARAVQEHLLNRWEEGVKISFAGKALAKEKNSSLPILQSIS